ncbi:hypothetical protein SMSP2_01537 [Limihaloglobus sulfuriphilus]|uniref:HEPN AbiJ-N-terminal domain-containing protein n=1 Tax=Limihaloglobus sulfuriphilus TaxID=1851148 RepID=A0A1Q2MEP2_9BACT|nr:hypothetical protein [Limihaloglobus sulfuriphilus]AQQ71171.1 hypothetical protein SMSP2_01537 [Limihaloglobus sulfuriphilus]
MSSFSERMGYVRPPEFLQLDSMTDELSNQLYNFCSTYINQIMSEINSRGGRASFIEDRVNSALKKQFGTFKILPFSSPNDFSAEKFKVSWSVINWHEKYTIVEFTIDHYAKYINDYRFKDIVIELNSILERENSGYRMNSDLELVPITDETELAEVEQAQNCEINSVATHMNNAVSLFSDRESPNYGKAIHEAISALEALAREHTDSKKDLSKLINQTDWHPALKQGISKLYAYTSDEGGIRHSHSGELVEIKPYTAKYIIVITSALINYIQAKQG